MGVSHGYSFFLHYEIGPHPLPRALVGGSFLLALLLWEEISRFFSYIEVASPCRVGDAGGFPDY